MRNIVTSAAYYYSLLKYLRSNYDRRTTQWSKHRTVVEEDVSLHPGSEIYGDVLIRAHTYANGPVFLSAEFGARIVIGRWCAIAHHLRIRTANHETCYPSMQEKLQQQHGFYRAPHYHTRGDVVIGDGCWIGDNVTVLPGASIGAGAVIGACAVVPRSVPPFAVAVGNPARVVKYRFSEEMIDYLLELNWWHWSDDRIARNGDFFNTDLTQVPVGELSRIVQ
jgi:virginiamycin A acetyltransferase